MKTEEFTPEKKFAWISKMYFGVLDSPYHDVNPFNEMEPFLEAKVKDLDWGKDPMVAKSKFCGYFMRILDLYDFKIPQDEIMKCLNNDNMKNRAVVIHLAAIGEFPEN